ncbi:MAG: isoprenyl transferase [Verrucomicrobia bacterium]|nr:isoprenyl transferase [Verrucomicrobiota bacterium]
MTANLKVPRHVAIIMDGNGRWARQRGLPRIEGHRAGAESVRAAVRAAGKFGVKYLTLYAFSVENWRRPKLEVSGLMRLLVRYLRSEIDELNRSNVRLETIGRLEDLPKSAQRELEEARQRLAKNTGLTLIVALSYGGRTELVDAMRKIAQEVKAGRLRPEQIDEATISSALYTARFPDPDLLIRTSGEMRLSNFLLWQTSYTEIWITPTLWPDFREPDFLQALEEYRKRERRFGGIEPT